MWDGRRHSVDVPFSRTLVALRRVRSLRDPSTNSTTKFSDVDNFTWETDSCNGISLDHGNAAHGGVLDNRSPRRSHNFVLTERREGPLSDPELDFVMGLHGSKSFSSKKLSRVQKRGSGPVKSNFVDESGYSRSNTNLIYESKLYCGGLHDNDNDQIDKALNLTYVSASTDYLEELELFGETTLSSRTEKDEPESNHKSLYTKRTKASKENGDAAGSCVGSSPSLLESIGIDGSSCNTSLFINENIDVMDYDDCRCGINCCWSSTRRSREPNLPSNREDEPLLSRGGETGLSGHERSCTYAKNEIAPYSNCPRSLSHKFQPKSFEEMVGQKVVACSLLKAIWKGNISSFYLFHGPRGTGKTSASRIFAAALNCLSLEEHRPCQLCRECRLFSSRKSRDIKEVDPSKINGTDRIRSLLKSAGQLPISSRYKVYIIDECQLLEGEIWSTLFNSLDDLPRHVVFVMVTADLDSLPRAAISQCQMYHFTKIKDVDIVNKLANICVEEGVDFDNAALNFIAAKSNGSLRNAEITLDQLSLLGKRITISLAHELIGIVSDEELLDLLDVSFSSDTSSTVVRARELMRSRIDPMQLISQLANLIMDILAGRSQIGISKVKRHFFRANTAELDINKLKHALNLLSEAEKQLRTSKNQATWLTVALLQLSAVDSTSLDANDLRRCLTNQQSGADDGCCSTYSVGDDVKHSSSCLCCEILSQNVLMQRDTKVKLDIIWRKVLERCHSNKLKRFLQKEGRLSSISVNQGMALAEVEFSHPDHVYRAEKSWKVIASSLQLVLGCDVEIRISVLPCASVRKSLKFKKPSFCIFSCTRRIPLTIEDEIQTDNFDFTSGRAIVATETSPSGNGAQLSSLCSQHNEPATSIRNDEGNVLEMCSSTRDGPTNRSESSVHSSKLEYVKRETQLLSIQEQENQQPSCFPKKVRFQRRLSSGADSRAICLRIRPLNKLGLSFPHKSSFETFFCISDPCNLCSGSDAFSDSSNNEDAAGKDNETNSKLHCRTAPTFPLGRHGS